MNRTRALVCALPLLIVTAAVGDDPDIDDMIKNAPPAATAPAEPDPKAKIPDALGTLQTRPPAGARLGSIELSNAPALEGRIWTTLETPLRLWVEKIKMYRDVDLSIIRRIDAVVISETMEDDWRWKKEGSDEKIYSGRKYPNIELAYKITLLNGQVMEGTIVAPIYFEDGKRRVQLALFKKYKGNLGEKLADLRYIKSISLPESPGVAKADDGKTTRLPLISD